jgi:hypothetical protein
MAISISPWRSLKKERRRRSFAARISRSTSSVFVAVPRSNNFHGISRAYSDMKA